MVITRAASALDLYVAGAMTGPFASSGKKQGFADFNARTLIQFMRTLSALRPRAAILENAPSILHQRHRKQLQRLLSAVKGYRLKIFGSVDSRHFGMPHGREMVYFVFLRIDALAFEAGACVDKITHIMEAAVLDKCPTFREFFANAGDAMVAQPISDPRCSCSYYKCCEQHKCNCRVCHHAGRQTKLCTWRKDTSQYVRRSQTDRLKYLRYWRIVKKSVKLKRSPTYFQLAGLHGISVAGLRISPRQRVMLNSLSLAKNLLGRNVIVDLSKSVKQPTVLRSDGVVPSLGRWCSRMLVPSVAHYISARQCLRLQGIDPNKIDLTDTKEDEIFQMVGGAMCLPAIGTALMACISVLRW